MWQQPYHMPKCVVPEPKTEIQTIRNLRVSELLTGKWSSLILIVLKKDWSLKIDFLRLSAIPELTHTQFPILMTSWTQLQLWTCARAGGEVLGVYHLQDSHGPVPVHSRAVWTTWNSRLFQKLMEHVLQGWEDCSTAYLDHVVVYSRSCEDHLQHIHRVLLQEAGWP